MSTIEAEYRKEYLEGEALKDYQNVLGKVIYVNHVNGLNEQDISVYMAFAAPIPVRVEESQDLFNWNDGWLDPYWNVSLVTDVPRLRGVRSFYVYGISYYKNTNNSYGKIVFESWAKKIKRTILNLFKNKG